MTKIRLAFLLAFCFVILGNITTTKASTTEIKVDKKVVFVNHANESRIIDRLINELINRGASADEVSAIINGTNAKDVKVCCTHSNGATCSSDDCANNCDCSDRDENNVLSSDLPE